MIDKITKLIPLSGGLLVFCGVLKLIFYYSYFNVHIIAYLEFQEIITSFFGDINIIIIFGMTMTLITMMMLNLLRKSSNLQLEEIMKKLLILLYPVRYKYFFWFLIAVLIQIGLLYFKILPLNYLMIYLISFCSIQMLTYLFLSKEENGEIDIQNFYGIVIMGVSLSLSIYLFARKDIRTTEMNGIETQIVMKDNIVNCNKRTKNLYIGKTNKFVFVKIDSTNSTLIIPIEQITKFEFK